MTTRANALTASIVQHVYECVYTCTTRTQPQTPHSHPYTPSMSRQSPHTHLLVVVAMLLLVAGGAAWWGAQVGTAKAA